VSSDSLISDRLLVQLMSAGQSDLVIGVVTLDDGDTVGPLIQTILRAFSQPLQRQMTVLIALDAGSSDNTFDVLTQVATQNQNLHPLRTVHTIIEARHDLPNQSVALHILLQAAQLLRARCLIIVDPRDSSLSIDEIQELATAIWEKDMDLVRPRFPRLPSEGLLLSQLIRPMLKAQFDFPLQEPVGLPLALSYRLLSEALLTLPWSQLKSSLAFHIHLTMNAGLNGFYLAELSVKKRDPHAARVLPLKDVFLELMSIVFTIVGEYRDNKVLANVQPIVQLGEACTVPTESAAIADCRQNWKECVDMREALAPVWKQILKPEHYISLEACLDQDKGIDDQLWVRILGDFVQTLRHSFISSRQLAQALLPLYYGRIAAVRSQSVDSEILAQLLRTQLTLEDGRKE
jgi:hypothetical protein